MDFLFFLGRFHVLVLHLPIGIIIAVVLLEFAARSEKFRYLQSAATYLWALASITSIVTVALGYMHFAEGGFDSDSGNLHRIYGTSVAIVTTLIWLLCARAPSIYRRLRIVFAAVILVLIILTGHYGGNLTHGASFLVEYAPRPVRLLVGLGERRPPVTDLALADPYLDIVRPILEARCFSCHSEDKKSGEFSMATYESTLAGGETGRAIVPGNRSQSELFKRITLPEGHDAFMPAEGRTPLTADQVAIMDWWITAGAPFATVVGEVEISPEVSELLAVAVGLAPGSGTGDAAPVSADSALVEAFGAAGFLARQLSQRESRLSVSLVSPGKPLDHSQLAVLTGAGDAIAELDLAGTGLTDADLRSLIDLTSLHILKISRNALTDGGLAALSDLPLEVLNIYGNAGITDASVETLGGLTRLDTVYVWQTGITADGIARLEALAPGLDVQGGSAQSFVAQGDVSQALATSHAE
jgi:uncharacterized membrane protein